MSKQWLSLAEAVGAEKGVATSDIQDVVIQALSAVWRRQWRAPRAVLLAPEGPQGTLYRVWQIVEAVTDPDRERTRASVPEDATVSEEGVWNEELPSLPLTRINASLMRQYLIQFMRERGRQVQATTWKPRINQLMWGIVSRVDKAGNCWIQPNDDAEVCLPRRELIPGERFKPGQRLMALVLRADAQEKGAPVVVTRASPDFVAALMEQEIAELSDGTLEIAATARVPGKLTKVAIRVLRPTKLDPLALCIGLRGSRIQAVTKELHHERVDLCLADESLPNFILNALAPAEIDRLVLDEERQVAWVSVQEEKLARAIGREGLNVRLASRLTGLTLHVDTPDNITTRLAEEAAKQQQYWIDALDVDANLAQFLIDVGFQTVEDVASPDARGFFLQEGIEDALIDELQERARSTVMDESLKDAERLACLQEAFEPVQVPAALAEKLHETGVVSCQDLADLAVDEILDLGVEAIDQAAAGAYIMEARRACRAAA